MSETKKVFVYQHKENGQVVDLINATNKEVTLKDKSTGEEFALNLKDFRNAYVKSAVEDVEVKEVAEKPAEPVAEDKKKSADKKPASKPKKAKKEEAADEVIEDADKVYATFNIHGREVAVTKGDFHKSFSKSKNSQPVSILDENGNVTADFESVLRENGLLGPDEKTA